MIDPSDDESQFQLAADAIRSADALLICAGAGMGVDSGLPDFRGDAGLWKQANWFHRDAIEAWGFLGHRLNLYREKPPHAGFEFLRQWAQKPPHGYFVFTSNVDGHFQKAGYSQERILECHGSLNYFQCWRSCTRAIWLADDAPLDIDETTLRLRSEPPRCPNCGQIARPSIAMFGDCDWLWDRYKEQRLRYVNWLRQVEGKNIVAIEIGAGLAVPTVREECEREAKTVIRINLHEAEPPQNGFSFPLRSLEALSTLHKYLQSRIESVTTTG